MDLYKAIRTLHDERKRLDKLIESLELVQARGTVSDGLRLAPRRGRRKMSMEERQQVSERMRRYWASRRQQVSGAAVAGAPVVPASPVSEPSCLA